MIKDCDKKVDCTFSSSSPNISSQYLAILYCCGRLKNISIYKIVPIYFKYILSHFLYCCGQLKINFETYFHNSHFYIEIPIFHKIFTYLKHFSYATNSLLSIHCNALVINGDNLTLYIAVILFSWSFKNVKNFCT